MAESITVKGSVISIDYRTGSFVVESEGLTYDCIYRSNTLEIRPHQLVSLSGSLRCVENKAYLEVNSIASLDSIIDQDMLDAYEKMAKVVNNARYIEKLEKRFSIPDPNRIHKIALIAGSESELSVTRFVMDYDQHCVGVVDVFKMNHNSLKDLESVVTRFIDHDLIVCLCDDLSPVEAYLLSCRENIKYLIGRKRCPYLVLIKPESGIDPLIERFCNKAFDSVDVCIRFISEIQEREREEIEKVIITARSIARELLRKRYLRLAFYRSHVKLTDVITEDRVKNLLKIRIDQLRIGLARKRSMMAVSIVNSCIPKQTSPVLHEDLLLIQNEFFCASYEAPVTWSESKRERDADRLGEGFSRGTTSWKDSILMQIEFFQENPEEMLLAHSMIDSLNGELLSRSQKIDESKDLLLISEEDNDGK